MRLPVELRYPVLWPMWCWYAFAAAYALLMGLIAGGIYWAFRGEFWEPFAYGAGAALAVGLAQLGWAHYRHARRSRQAIDGEGS